MKSGMRVLCENNYWKSWNHPCKGLVQQRKRFPSYFPIDLQQAIQSMVKPFASIKVVKNLTDKGYIVKDAVDLYKKYEFGNGK